MDFVRARTKEQIIIRREEIISACDALFSQHGYEGVNFNAISEMTSVKRPTFYLYYKTKDEVLLDLLKREMLDWNAFMQKVIHDTEIMTKEQYCTFLVETIASREKMLKLLTILITTIENQCRLEKLAEFKRESGGAQATIRGGLDKYFPDGDPSKKDFFMISFMSYVHGLYPLSFPTKKQIDAMSTAGREYIPPDFKDTLYRGILLLLRDLYLP
jgi:AcrR family transcriptional regulator